MNPEDYGKNKLQAQMQAQQYMEEELANEIEYKVSEAPIIDAAMQTLTRDQNYARSTTIVSEAEDLYGDVIKAVTPYKDIISFPISKGKNYVRNSCINTKMEKMALLLELLELAKTELCSISHIFLLTL